jgi:hypothetical protein
MDNKELLAWAVYKLESETEQIELAKIKIRDALSTGGDH